MPRSSGFLWNPSGSPSGPVIVTRDRYQDPAPIFPPPAPARGEQVYLIEYRPETRTPRSAIASSAASSAGESSSEYFQTVQRRPRSQSYSTSRHLDVPARVIQYPQGYDPHTIPPPSPEYLIPPPQAQTRVVLPPAPSPPVVAQPQQQPSWVPPPAPDVPLARQYQPGQAYHTPIGEPIRETPSLRVNIPRAPSSQHSRGHSGSSGVSARSTSPSSHRSRTSGGSSRQHRHRRRRSDAPITPDTPVSDRERRKEKRMIEEANYTAPPWKTGPEVSWKERDGSKVTQYYYD